MDAKQSNMNDRDRPSKAPGGCECKHCGHIFIGDESHQFCGVCVAIVAKELKRIQDGR
jgi:rubrerythrin